jgi:hypothetical protein
MATVQVPKEELVRRTRGFMSDAAWFENNLDSGKNLRDKYSEHYVAVRNNEVVDSDKSLRRLLNRLESKYSSDEIGATFIEYLTRTKIDLII